MSVPLGRGRALFRKLTPWRLKSCGFASSETVAQEAKSTLWNTMKDAARSKVVLIGVLGVTTLMLGANRSVERWYERQVLQRVLRGFVPPVTGLVSTVERTDVRRLLHNLFIQELPSRFYYIIMGPHATGKSLLLKQVVADIGGGAGYIDVGALPKRNFGTQLGEAINYRFQEHANVFNFLGNLVAGTKIIAEPKAQDQVGSLEQAAEALEKAAATYAQLTGRSFVLVVDGVDRLAEQEPELLTALQEYAKHWAEQRLVTLVFVAGEEATEEKLKERQAFERAWEIIPVPEIGVSQAAAYLQRLGVRDEAAARRIGDLVGGRFHQLEKCAAMMVQGASLEAVEHSMLLWAEQHYIASGLLDTTDQQVPGLKAVRLLVAQASAKSGSGRMPAISVAQWRQAVPSREMQEALLKGKVFRIDRNAGTVSFENRAALAYARKMLWERAAIPLK